MGLEARVAKLSPDVIAAIQNYENELTAKFGNQIILIALENTK